MVTTEDEVEEIEDDELEDRIRPNRRVFGELAVSVNEDSVEIGIAGLEWKHAVELFTDRETAARQLHEIVDWLES